MRSLDSLRRFWTRLTRPRRDRLEAKRLRLEVVRCYRDGRHAEAAQVARRLLNLQRQMLGEFHPDYATGLTNLALLLQRQDDLDGAEAFLRQALSIRLATQGQGHADVRANRNLLALLLPKKQERNGGPPERNGTPSLSQPASHASLGVLSQQASALKSRFISLYENLESTSNRLSSPGVPPPDLLFEQLAVCRRELAALCEQTLGLAVLLNLSSPPPETLAGLRSLVTFLQTVAQAARQRDSRDEIRGHALNVLDRVLALQPLKDTPPLRRCQADAATLRDAIAGAPWSALPPDTERLADGHHPLADLLEFVAAQDLLSDERWRELYDAVSSALGKPLAIAAARRYIAAVADLR